MEEKVLTPVQAGERLQIAPRTVIKRVKAGQLHGVKVGKQWRIPESAITELLQQEPQAA